MGTRPTLAFLRTSISTTISSICQLAVTWIHPLQGITTGPILICGKSAPGEVPLASPETSGARPTTGPAARPMTGPGARPTTGPAAQPMTGPGARPTTGPAARSRTLIGQTPRLIPRPV